MYFFQTIESQFARIKSILISLNILSTVIDSYHTWSHRVRVSVRVWFRVWFRVRLGL